MHIRQNPARQLGGGDIRKPEVCVRPLLMRSKTLGLPVSPPSTERSSKGLFAFQTWESLGGPTGVNSELPKKRYWWERVCNTAQAGGEESASDPNGFRVSTVSSQGWLKVFLGLDWERLSAARNL